MPELPKRRSAGINGDILIKRDYSYNNIVSDNVNSNQINAIIICEDDLALNMDKLIEILSQNKKIQLKFKDFESARVIDKVLKGRIPNEAFLMDDSLRKNREYIDLTLLSNISLTIPLNYLAWGVKFNDSVDTYCFLVNNPQGNYLNPTSNNGNEKISYEDYVSIIKKIDELSKYGVTSDKDKVALISDYIQSQTQFIEGYESSSIHGVFITPDFPKQYPQAAYIETVLNHNNGKCVGISNASTLLLNNPQMNMEVESVYGCEHVWNKVLIDGKYYYFDNTWSITRNEDMNEDGLIALSFSRKFLCFGQKTANVIGHHEPKSIFIYDGIISEDDISDVNYQQHFVYRKEPVYRSKRK